MRTHSPDDSDCITTYQHSIVMPRLETKLRAELAPGARVISNAFRFPSWQPARIMPRLDSVDGEVLLYIQESVCKTAEKSLSAKED